MSKVQPHHRAALQHAERGNWHEAHEIVQAQDDTLSALIHAHLHRVEGDSANAAYWYRKAGEPMPDTSPKDELQQLIQRCHP